MPKQNEPRPAVPVVESDALYYLSDIRRAFGLSDRQLARWKRAPDFLALHLPGGDVIWGQDLIDWLRANRRKTPKGGTPDES